MPVARISLSNDLLYKARRRAIEAGYADLNSYLSNLIQKDVDFVPSTDLGTLAQIRRKARQSVRLVRPSMRSKGKGSRTKAGKSTRQIRQRLLDGMMSYMKATEDPGYGYACGYQLKHIRRCAAIVEVFLAEISGAPRSNPMIALKAVQRVVMKLNKLNASCGDALIATDQREDLCKLIFAAVQKKGVDTTADITEPWREW